MRTITATFHDAAGATIATAQATFASLPGEARIQWTGVPPRPDGGGTLPQLAYAGTFEGWMQALANRTSLTVQITSEGDWKVFEE